MAKNVNNFHTKILIPLHGKVREDIDSHAKDAGIDSTNFVRILIHKALYGTAASPYDGQPYEPQSKEDDNQ